MFTISSSWSLAVLLPPEQEPSPELEPSADFDPGPEEGIRNILVSFSSIIPSTIIDGGDWLPLLASIITGLNKTQKSKW